jgi:hypothetical protein
MASLLLIVMLLGLPSICHGDVTSSTTSSGGILHLTWTDGVITEESDLKFDTSTWVVTEFGLQHKKIKGCTLEEPQALDFGYEDPDIDIKDEGKEIGKVFYDMKTVFIKGKISQIIYRDQSISLVLESASVNRCVKDAETVLKAKLGGRRFGER